MPTTVPTTVPARTSTTVFRSVAVSAGCCRPQRSGGNCQCDGQHGHCQNFFEHFVCLQSLNSWFPCEADASTKGESNSRARGLLECSNRRNNMKMQALVFSVYIDSHSELQPMGLSTERSLQCFEKGFQFLFLNALIIEREHSGDLPDFDGSIKLSGCANTSKSCGIAG
ncbi:hypothetical protein DSTSK_30690 [Desulforhabdus sp. TSK]|nr:hypothetical protein DSTSK_30690 [Desulforhabdus sp. TSK]